jgi:lipoprotein-releasing system ATP-binding protein
MSDRMQALAEELQSVREVRDVRQHASSHPVLRLDRLVRTFHQGPRKIAVLNGASADILPGQAVALVGPSGAGKSTLLHIAGLLETPDGGHVIINGLDCTGMGDADRTRVRRVQMGFVYQFHQLLPEFSALENVIIPQMILGRSRRVAAQRAAQMLGSLGLADRVNHRPAQLSGGEQQRTAIARALANEPRLILADEPTGNLDPHTAEHVFDALLHLIHTTGVAALIATHNLELARRMDRVLRVEDGLLVEVAPASVR